jgi:hypothetical protein
LGRRSIAKHIQAELEEVDDDSDEYLVIYNFVKHKSTARFWRNLNRLSGLKGKLVQRSAFLTQGKRAARAVSTLASHYGADVAVFWVKQIEK